VDDAGVGGGRAVLALDHLADGLGLAASRTLRPRSRPRTSAKLDFTITLARIMFPFILLVALAALVMGMLNARQSSDRQR